MDVHISNKILRLKLILTLLMTAATTLPDHSTSARANDSFGNNACSLFIAPSTIPGGGLGIFTSRSIPNNTEIGVSDVIIPLYDLSWHQEDDFFWVFQDYVWDGASMMGMSAETDVGMVDAYAPGLDCAINCHLALLNVERHFPTFDTTTMPHRSQYPSAGSMTPYWNGTTYALTNIPAGAELFKFYGDQWFTSRPHAFEQDTPLSGDFRKAEELSAKIHDSIDKRWHLSQEAQESLYQIILGLGGEYSSTFGAMPRNLAGVKQVAANGIGSIYQADHVRLDVSEISEARCIENIVPGVSTIEGSGRGGFAARWFSQGEIITGSPLLHSPDKERMELYQWDEERGLKNLSRADGKQIVVNYCWGHSSSSLLLCPYGSGVNYINHSREEANVMIQWAPQGHLGQDNAWFHWAPERMSKVRQPHLAWDFVALRDIRQGEEFFVDYGDTWIAAWETHVSNWKPSVHIDYKSAAEWNEVLRDKDIIRTEEELPENPYPWNVHLVCHNAIRSNTYHLRQQRKTADELWNIAMDGVPCKVLTRRLYGNNITYYTVEIQHAEGQVVQRTKVDRKMLRFRDNSYSTDIHLKGAFRQEAQIPDDMMPSAWRNQRYDRSHDEL